MSRAWGITGGAGFIGGNLGEFLLESGESVVALDNFLTGNRTRISGLQKKYPNNFKFIEGDIRDPLATKELLQDCTHCVHLAAQASAPLSLEKPIETNSINVEGFLQVLESAASAKVKHLIYASSCAVFGDCEILPLTETSPVYPITPYATSKLTDEWYADNLAPRLAPMTVTGLRFFNIYGPWQDPTGPYGAVIPKWIDSAVKETPPTIFGDGSQTRDFCYVENIAILLLSLAQQNAFPVKHRFFNIGSGEVVNLHTLWQMISESVSGLTGKQCDMEPILKSARSGDILHSYGDITRAHTELGFETKIGLAEGLRRTIEHFAS